MCRAYGTGGGGGGGRKQILFHSFAKSKGERYNRVGLVDSILWYTYISILTIFLQRLPLTIPELVQISPTKSTDGHLYTGMPEEYFQA